MTGNNTNSIENRVLYEDNHLIVINKLASELVQGDKTGDIPLVETVKSFLKDKYNKPGNVFCGVIHRLDRPTSGLIIFAKTGKALSRMNELFKKKDVQKKYWAVVEQLPPKEKDTITHFLVRNQKQNKSYAHNKQVPDSKEAKLTYNLLGESDRYFLLEIDLHTGRHHQIRCQLAAIGCTIKGDLKYGSKRSNKDGSIHLHAREISFNHPVKKEEIKLTAPIISNDTVWQFFANQNN